MLLREINWNASDLVRRLWHAYRRLLGRDLDA